MVVFAGAAPAECAVGERIHDEALLEDLAIAVQARGGVGEVGAAEAAGAGGAGVEDVEDDAYVSDWR